MAYDPSPDGAALDTETITALRDALASYSATPSDHDALRCVLRAVSREARQKAMLPEQLLIVLKNIWYTLPAAHAAHAAHSASDEVRLLQRAVTICIKEYYGDDAG